MGNNWSNFLILAAVFTNGDRVPKTKATAHPWTVSGSGCGPLAKAYVPPCTMKYEDFLNLADSRSTGHVTRD